MMLGFFAWIRPFIPTQIIDRASLLHTNLGKPQKKVIFLMAVPLNGGGKEITFSGTFYEKVPTAIKLEGGGGRERP